MRLPFSKPQFKEYIVDLNWINQIIKMLKMFKPLTIT